jgi:hypothetical protein
MWTDRVLALFSLAVMIVFLGILVAFVKRIDLTIVVVVVVAMATYDFYRELTGSAS